MAKPKAHYYVYILRCKNGMYYTGSTGDVVARIKLHNQGRGARCLRGKGPVELVYAKKYAYYKNALHAERNIKKLTRKQKTELIKIYVETQKPKHCPSQFCSRKTNREGAHV